MRLLSRAYPCSRRGTDRDGVLNRDTPVRNPLLTEEYRRRELSLILTRILKK